ncbi:MULTISPECIES: LysR family transcriptional regulator [unclassified Bradyrhizobium]|uniref:LysR family transcriptional regulator n=1 Tax=unclassified Bradyrhizobium TaxID=2631580 RepID=UPI001408F420|nr:LysR family transcriptional regulator [Bradyrhizobium sp. 2S1]MCK7673751.1 LysR family transcriptional regulator [Bradyrhizobium sp. 2S1]
MDMNAHTLPLLVSLSVMLDERNVTRAAARLGLSQPALSAQLARLRDVFGDQLLTPAASGKGMVLTPCAIKLREPLRDALRRLDDVVRTPPVFEPKSSQRTFAIGANDNASAMLGGRLVQRMRRSGAATTRLAFRAVDPARLAGQLEAGEIDIALVSKNALPNGMPHKPLLEERFMMAQRKAHPRGSRRPSLKEYASLEHVIVSGDGGGFRGFVDDILAARGLTRRVGVSVQYYSVVPVILQSTDFVCTLPARFLARYSNVLTATALPFDAGHFSLYATWHARFDNDPGHVWLRNLLTDCAED